MATIKIPYRPRPLQRKAHNKKERFALLVCHRRFGKTVFVINEAIKQAVTCKLKAPRFAYIAPFYKQAKNVAWDMLKYYCQPIPNIVFNESELKADFPNGARISLYGGDNPDSLRGIYLDGVMMDEYAQMSPRLWAEIIRPAISDRKGWAIFIGTPKGHNNFFDLYQEVKDDEDWYVKVHRASETNYIDAEELEAAKKDMSEDQYQQEFECSWTAAIQGAYYGRLLEEAEKESRIGKVQHDTGALVETWWDLGIGDSTAIWFVQRIGAELRVIDYYENNGESLGHYANVLQDKAKENEWNYGDHVFPHDVRQRSLDTGRTRVETLQNLGVEPTIIPQMKVEDGIEAVRRKLKNCWFDEMKCRRGIDALRQYRSQYDEKNQVFKLRPVHDWASHAADAFRYGCLHEPMKLDWADIEYSNTGIV
jgi:phage terminase large subunit